MKTHIPLLLLGSVLVGCTGNQVRFVDAADPALPTKLGISDRDWSQIKQLGSAQKGFVIKDAGKPAANVIEVEFKKPDDARNDQGGPVERYEKKNAGWVQQSDFKGCWATGKNRPS